MKKKKEATVNTFTNSTISFFLQDLQKTKSIKITKIYIMK
jgi:hypothetical protein